LTIGDRSLACTSLADGWDLGTGIADCRLSIDDCPMTIGDRWLACVSLADGWAWGLGVRQPAAEKKLKTQMPNGQWKTI
jgi:hypothetical protein